MILFCCEAFQASLIINFWQYLNALFSPAKWHYIESSLDTQRFIGSCIMSFFFFKALQNPSLSLDLTRPFSIEQIHPNCLIHSLHSSPNLTNGNQMKGWWKRGLLDITGSTPPCSKVEERKKDQASRFYPLLQKNLSPQADCNLVYGELSPTEQLLETQSPRMIFPKGYINL